MVKPLLFEPCPKLATSYLTLIDVMYRKDIDMSRFPSLLIPALSTIILASLIATPAQAQFSINGGATSQFSFINNAGTSNGLPSGGSSSGSTGTGIGDAAISSTGQGDAYDNAAMVFVNDTLFSNVLVQNGQTANGGTQAIAGLNVSLSYFVSPTLPVVRTFVTLTNPTNSPISVPLTYVNNSGSDGGTIIKQTFSGDLTFDTNDRYLISDDQADDNSISGDVANTYVFFGEGATITPSAVSTTVFSSASTEGALATFNLTLGASETASFLFFNRIDTTTNNAIANVGAFNSLVTLGATDLLTDLTSAQLNTVRNFGVIGTASAPEPGTVALLVLGLSTTAIVRRRQRQSSSMS